MQTLGWGRVMICHAIATCIPYAWQYPVPGDAQPARGVLCCFRCLASPAGVERGRVVASLADPAGSQQLQVQVCFVAGIGVGPGWSMSLFVNPETDSALLPV